MTITNQRKRADLRLPYSIKVGVREWAEKLGVSQNSVIVISIANYLATLSRLETDGRKRGRLLDDIEEVFNETLEEVRKTQYYR